MNATVEIFKDLEGYEGYEVSNFGRVKSFKKGKERIMVPRVGITGYYILGIFGSDGKQKTIKVHQLVAMAFLGHVPCGMKLVINHKDGNKLNNHVDNIEVVTARQNSHHFRPPAGAYWHTKDKKWESAISINGKTIWLGAYKTKEEASAVYFKKLSEVA